MTERRGPKLRGPVTDKDFENLEGLLKIQCTLQECALVFGCDPKTIETRVKEKYGIKFSELSDQKREFGKISIRRKQWSKGVKDGNVTMLIWLGKQYCGQRDKIEARPGPGFDDDDEMSPEEVKAEVERRMKQRAQSANIVGSAGTRTGKSGKSAS